MTMMQKLAAAGRSPEIPAEADAYGWLEGSWDLDIVYYGVDVRDQQLRGEAHFGWVLEGRAMQDVWIMKHPDVMARTARPFASGSGSRCVAGDVDELISGRRDELIGRRIGNDIIQIGTHGDGTHIRWSVLDVTPSSFRWVGDALQPDGETWKVEAEFHARRRT
jgi:hypothetical protein